MMTAYPACFFKEEEGYSVIFPDLDDLATCGETQEDALAMAVDCLAGYLFWCGKEGEPVRAASAVDEIRLTETAKRLDLDSDDGFISLVVVDIEQYAKNHFEKSVKKTLSIPSWLNEAACKAGINFSAVLQEALKKQLGLE